MSNILASKSLSFYKDFLRVGNQIKQLALLLNKEVEPVHRKDNPCFLMLSEADQSAVLERLKIYQQLFEMSTEKGAPPVNEKRLLWLALKLLKFIPSSDLMTLIEDDDLIEVFVANRQIYRSFNYYDFCSYSFDELESTPWELLFHREDSNIHNQMLKEAEQVIKTQKMVVSATPEHVVSEISSPFRNKVSYKLKYIIPIKDAESTRTDCFVTVLSARLLETVPREKRMERMMNHQRDREMTTPLY